MSFHFTFRNTMSCLALVLLLGGSMIGSAFAADLYVSPSGNDAGDGSNVRPFATLAKALKAAEGQGGVTIFMQPGTYYLKKGVKVGEKNSGTLQQPLQIVPSSDFGAGEVRISGGAKLDNFRPITPEEAKDLISDQAKSKVMVADLSGLDPRCYSYPGDKYQYRTGSELFFNDKRMTLARWPNEGFVHIDKVVDTGKGDAPSSEIGKSGKVKRPGSFTLKEDRPSRWKIDRGVWVGGFWCHDWSFETLRVADFDPAEKCFKLKVVHGYGIGPSSKWNKHPRRFYAENVFEEIDSPGEWWIDRQAKKLFFWPPVEDKNALKKARVVLSFLTEPLIAVDKAENVKIEGLILEHGKTAATVRNAKNVLLKGLTVRNLCGTAVSFGNSNKSGIINSHIHDVGASGVTISAGDRKTLTRGDCFAVGNHIHHFARFKKTYAGAIHLNGVGNRAAKNHIHDSPHSGIFHGGNEHLIELNNLHDLLLETSDAGVIYTGRDWASRGNVIRWNYIHRIPNMAGVGTIGIYLDDCDSGDLLIGNIIHGLYRGIMIGGGRDNEVKGNVFIDCKMAVHFDARAIGWAASHYGKGSWDLEGKCKKWNYQSPPWSERYPSLARIMDEEPFLPLGNQIEDNVVINCDKWINWIGKTKTPELLPRLEKGVKNNLVLKDKNPEFVDPAAGNFQFKDSSPVWKDLPTFKRIPVEKIGPTK